MRRRHCEDDKLLGFSLIEVMVASAIGLIAMLGIGQLIITQFKAVSAVRMSGEANNLVTLARLVLGNQTACKFNINKFSRSTIPANPGNMTMKMSEIADQGGVVIPVIPPPALPANPAVSVWVSDISLSRFVRPDPAEFIYRADMTVTVTKRGVVMGGSQTRQPIAMQFLTDAAGTIMECAAGALVPVLPPPGSPGGPLALSDICIYLGGIVNGSTCTLPTVPPPAGGAVVALYQCPQGGSCTPSDNSRTGGISDCINQVTTTKRSCTTYPGATARGQIFCNAPQTVVCPRIN
ncbi:MAG: prepilin-type N-terminal cleavage/methylation domain-containing protein [Pseudomonadota bacterium]|nr:prepilin-type N-terminal cleavage/methylation domain-containing protein [Pseudomonadota bacterium]